MENISITEDNRVQLARSLLGLNSSLGISSDVDYAHEVSDYAHKASDKNLVKNQILTQLKLSVVIFYDNLLQF